MAFFEDVTRLLKSITKHKHALGILITRMITNPQDLSEEKQVETTKLTAASITLDESRSMLQERIDAFETKQKEDGVEDIEMSKEIYQLCFDVCACVHVYEYAVWSVHQMFGHPDNNTFDEIFYFLMNDVEHVQRVQKRIGMLPDLQ